MPKSVGVAQNVKLPGNVLFGNVSDVETNDCQNIHGPDDGDVDQVGLEGKIPVFRAGSESPVEPVEDDHEIEADHSEQEGVSGKIDRFLVEGFEENQEEDDETDQHDEVSVDLLGQRLTVRDIVVHRVEAPEVEEANAPDVEGPEQVEDELRARAEPVVDHRKQHHDAHVDQEHVDREDLELVRVPTDLGHLAEGPVAEGEGQVKENADSADVGPDVEEVVVGVEQRAQERP